MLEQHEHDFLKELLKHPGWPVFVRVLESNKNSLIEQLYISDKDQTPEILQRWRALETLYRECKILETSNDIVQLGLDNNS
jgi:hypothetical protein